MKINALPTDTVRHWQSGGTDIHGQPPEVAISDGQGTLCRHCLCMVAKGDRYLIVAHRPFSTVQPYAETGPLFVCADHCAPHRDDGTLPPILRDSPDYLVKGYSADERIVYGTGSIVENSRIKTRAAEIFADPNIAFAHVRSARNNCFQVQIDRE